MHDAAQCVGDRRRRVRRTTVRSHLCLRGRAVAERRDRSRPRARTPSIIAPARDRRLARSSRARRRLLRRAPLTGVRWPVHRRAGLAERRDVDGAAERSRRRRRSPTPLARTTGARRRPGREPVAAVVDADGRGRSTAARPRGVSLLRASTRRPSRSTSAARRDRGRRCTRDRARTSAPEQDRAPADRRTRHLRSSSCHHLLVVLPAPVSRRSTSAPRPVGRRTRVRRRPRRAGTAAATQPPGSS